MLSVIRDILFAEGDVSYGNVFAQCVQSVPFWNHTLDEGDVARCMVGQLFFANESYSIEKNCVCRSRRFDRDETLEPSSPVKVPL